jgi:hypothetical protein
MTVTLDDVAAILRLLVEGAFFIWVPYTSDDAQKVLVGELGMIEYEAEQEITIVRGRVFVWIPWSASWRSGLLAEM